ncbi:Uncharacterised protein [Mycobacterium tuberculosis]|nr:Uncharacterised protein [Mycobacterium tuberculosis]
MILSQFNNLPETVRIVYFYAIEHIIDMTKGIINMAY